METEEEVGLSQRFFIFDLADSRLPEDRFTGKQPKDFITPDGDVMDLLVSGPSNLFPESKTCS